MELIIMGAFITFEGGEGSGKTTIIRKIVASLENLGYSVVSTREPGGIDIAEQIRDIILKKENTKMTKETEALLYAASRMQHLSERVIPALNEGKIVICDRYLDSSLAYQGYARGLGIENVLQANHFALDHLPDLTFFIDVTPEVGLKRIERRNELNRLDLENLDFHHKVYEGYLKLCEMYPKRIIKINGERSIDAVYNDVLNRILAYLKR